ncbi:MAG: electron transport complex subunit RsxC [Bacteroidales bacterium]
MKTFSIGGIHPNDNKLAANSPIEQFPLGESVSISLSQHLGAPAEPIVSKGERVKCGQLIAKASGFISANIHSSVSGVVKSIAPHPDIIGNMVPHITIDVDSRQEWIDGVIESNEILREIHLNPKEIIERIAEMGIVGLGGASFPTHIKLSPPPGKKAHFLIINGAECEPYITSDYRIMVEHPEEILIGAKIMMRALGVPKCIIGIEGNKRPAIEAIDGIASLKYPQIKVVPLKTRYPQGGEKQLIEALLGREVPSMALPIDVGVVVQNVATALSVYEAVQKNRPLIENFITVTGTSHSIQKNLKVRVGTKIDSIIEKLELPQEPLMKVISGGPMMGKAISRLEATTLKSTSALLFLTAKESKRGEESNCIRCSKCVEACPMGLEPYLLNKLARANRDEDLEENMVQDCIECGSCSYVCPANIPLLDTIRLSKSKILKLLRSRPKK